MWRLGRRKGGLRLPNAPRWVLCGHMTLDSFPSCHMAPDSSLLQEQVARPSRMLLAEVTDGHSVVNAIEYQPMGPTLCEDIPPGTKVGGVQYLYAYRLVMSEVSRGLPVTLPPPPPPPGASAGSRVQERDHTPCPRLSAGPWWWGGVNGGSQQSGECPQQSFVRLCM